MSVGLYELLISKGKNEVIYQTTIFLVLHKVCKSNKTFRFVTLYTRVLMSLVSKI